MPHAAQHRARGVRAGTVPVRHLASRAGVLAIISLLLVSALVSPAEAAKKSEPANTGVVERLDTIGGHVIEPIPVDVGGTTLPILTVIGWDSALDDDGDGFGAFCADQPPVFNGVEQFVATPSGNVHVVVHNADIPVLLFDVTGVDSPEDFIAKCIAGDIEPLAQGTVKQRPIINADDDGVTIKVKSRGVVTDTGGQEWQLQAFYREAFDFSSAEGVVTSWVSLRKL